MKLKGKFYHHYVFTVDMDYDHKGVSEYLRQKWELNLTAIYINKNSFHWEFIFQEFEKE